MVEVSHDARFESDRFSFVAIHYCGKAAHVRHT